MRSILQLCVMVLMLLGAGNRVWGKVAVGQNIAVRGFAEGGAFGNEVDEPPALMSSGEAAARGYDCTVDVRDGPNVYAYVKQNPWTAWDPEGLEETKERYFPRGAKGLVKLEGSRETGEPLTRYNKGKLEVLANHYESWGNKNLSWFNGPYGAPDKSEWEPAAKYGITQPTSSARRTVDTNENWDPNKNAKAFGDAANHPTVQAVGTIARVSIEASAMVMTGGMSRAGGAVSAAAKNAAAKAGVTVTQPNRIYSARELIRRANEPGPFHNFPESFNAHIFQNGTKNITPNFWRTAKPNMSNDSIMYSLPGQVNGRAGVFEIGVRPSASGRTEVIMHRFFNPTP